MTKKLCHMLFPTLAVEYVVIRNNHLTQAADKLELAHQRRFHEPWTKSGPSLSYPLNIALARSLYFYHKHCHQARKTIGG